MTHLDQTGGEKRGEQTEKKERKEERFLSEKPSLLSKFLGDRTDGFRQSKGKSSSSRQGLCIETGVGEFRQTPRGRGFFSYSI